MDHDLEWLTPTGCVFQGAGSWGIDGTSEHYWIPETVEGMKAALDKQPDLRVTCSLIGNCRKSYSRCRLANVRLRLDGWVYKPS